MQFWQRLHSFPLLPRVALKILLFLALVVLVLYPRFWVIPAQLARLADLNAALDPTEPRLAALERQVQTILGGPAAEQQALAAVQAVVHQRLPYAWDWETWGVMDYLPTAAEALDLGREDCDGRAVVAASLLRRMGYDARLVSNILHVWVITPAGETMNPGEGVKTLEGTPDGTRLRINGIFQNLARGTGFGVQVFPLTRLLLIVLGLAAVTMHPWSSPLRRAAGCVLLVLAVGMTRDAGPMPVTGSTHPLWGTLGLATGLAGWIVLAIRGAERRSTAAPPE